jgi:tripartite-type tricarboxylate transporter receptor subunit TctC
MKRTASLCLFLLAGVLLAGQARVGLAAEPAFPTRPVRLIVPFVPGGSTDLLARIVAPRVGEVLGQQVVVDNRAGASSVIGTQIAAKAPADGYTLLLADTAFTINASLFRKLPYDPERDFTFVTILATSPTVLVANPRLKVRSIEELIAAAKKNPGKITAANAGAGSNNHLEMEMFTVTAKIELLHVPFKGNGEAITSVIAGHTDLISTTPVTVVQHVKAGTLVALAISGKQQHPSLPGVPTYESAGLAADKPESFRFIASPRGLPEPIEKKLASAFGAVMTAPDMQSRLKANGFDPEFAVGAEARTYVLKAIKLYGEAVKRSGVKAD